MTAKTRAAREPISEGVKAARRELRTVARDLDMALTRLVEIVAALREAEASAPTIGTRPDGSRDTAEGWMAGSLSDSVVTELEKVVTYVRQEARLDWRPEIRRSVAAQWEEHRNDGRILELVAAMRAGRGGEQEREELGRITRRLLSPGRLWAEHREAMGLTRRELRELLGAPAPFLWERDPGARVSFSCLRQRLLSAEEENGGKFSISATGEAVPCCT